MRKLLVAAVGFVTVLMAMPVYAVDVNFSGEAWVRGFWTDNQTDGNSSYDDHTRFADGRFRLKTAIKAGVTTGVVVVDFANCYPSNPAPGGSTGSTINNSISSLGNTGNCRFGTGGLGNSDNVVGLREAYLKIDLTKVGFVLGRQTLKLGHGIIFDTTGDAVTAILPLNGSTLTASMIQVNDANAFGTVPGINNDTTVWMVNLGMDRGNHVINIYDAYLYDQTPATTLGSSFYPTVDGPLTTSPGPFGNDKIWINYLGVSLDAKAGSLNLAFEGTYDFGSLEAATAAAGPDIRVGGWNLMGDVTADTGGARLGGTVVVTSGQSPSAVGSANIADISGNFQLGNILVNGEMNTDRDGSSLSGGAGVPGGIGGAGLFAVKLHADMMPSDRLDVGGAVIFAQTTAQPCGGCQRNIGYELDANSKYQVDDNLAVLVGAGYLITGSGAADFYNVYNTANLGPPPVTGSNSNIWKLSAKVVFTF
ncbi:MAG TPA: hypothetical protein VML36_01395 [Nitrospiria bacterium]|nr:hypothetical protein [Nitrospiria bacterium]